MIRSRWCLTLLYLSLLSTVPGLAQERAGESMPLREASRIEDLVIDEIEILGVKAFSDSDITKVLEMEAGDRLDQKRVVRTATNIQELYRRHGYERIQVQSRLRRRPGARQEHILEIAISEGQPTRVNRIHLTVSDPRWVKKLESLRGRLGIAAGEILNQEKLQNGYRSLQDAISSQDFMGVKVGEARVETVSPDPGRFGKLIGETNRWVDLHVHVDLGERVSFGFRGNKVFTAMELSAMVAEQRLLGLSQDYLERIRLRIEDEYRKLGYERILIKTFTFEDADRSGRHVTYQITEGPRVRIKEIQFDGNQVFSDGTLLDVFEEKEAPSISRGYFVEKDVQRTAEVLVEWMKSQGYLSAKLISVTKTFSGVNEEYASVQIYLYEGEQTIVRSVSFPGLSVLSAEEVKVALGNREGQPLNLFDFNEGLEKLKTLYRDRGYLDFRIANEGTSTVVSYADENRSAHVLLELIEGLRYHVSRIDITGLRDTRPEVVLREMHLRRGDILEERKWLASESALRRLGIFATVTIRVHPDPDRRDGKLLQVVVEEGSPGLIAGGVGVRNDLGGRVFGQLSYGNLWGRNHTASLTGNANRRYGDLGAEFCPSEYQSLNERNKDHCFVEYNTELAYTWPWALLGDTTFRPRLTYDRNQYRQFDATSAGVALSLQRELLSQPNLQGILTYSLERVRQFNANSSVDEQRVKIGSITPALILDMRDNPLLPSKGIYTSASFELARPEFLSQQNPEPVAYSRTQFRFDGYYALPRDIGTFFSFRTGIEYNFARPPEGLDPDSDTYKRYSIPVIKQFSLGGVGSLRGFKEQGLNVQDQAILGSLSYVNYRAQLDLPFAGPMRFGPFVDAANLIVDSYHLTRDLHFGIGAGLHYRSPVGPVNFDIGVNPNPRRGDDTYKLHFSIGTI